MDNLDKPAKTSRSNTGLRQRNTIPPAQSADQGIDPAIADRGATSSPPLDEPAKMYEGSFTLVKRMFFAGDYDSADEVANSLLLRANLPVAYRVWCHMVLASAGAGTEAANKHHSKTLGHAQAAVDIINDCKNDPGLALPEKTVARAHEILRKLL